MYRINVYRCNNFHFTIYFKMENQFKSVIIKNNNCYYYKNYNNYNTYNTYTYNKAPLASTLIAAYMRNKQAK